MTTDDDESTPIPLAHSGAPTLPPLPPLLIGEPFVISGGLEVLDTPQDQRHPGTVAVVRCEGDDDAPCGQPFMIRLLEPGVKTCPRCQRRYTYLLVLARDDDDEIVHDAVHQILRANGFPVPDEGDDDDDDQADDDDPADQAG